MRLRDKRMLDGSLQVWLGRIEDSRLNQRLLVGATLQVSKNQVRRCLGGG